MPVLLFFWQFLSDMIDLTGVGAVADECSAVKFILEQPLDSGVFP